MAKEKMFNLIQCGERIAGSDDREAAIRRAKQEAKQNGQYVIIEERRITIIVLPDGTVKQ